MFNLLWNKHLLRIHHMTVKCYSYNAFHWHSHGGTYPSSGPAWSGLVFRFVQNQWAVGGGGRTRSRRTCQIWKRLTRPLWFAKTFRPKMLREKSQRDRGNDKQGRNNGALIRSLHNLTQGSSKFGSRAVSGLPRPLIQPAAKMMNMGKSIIRKSIKSIE